MIGFHSLLSNILDIGIRFIKGTKIKNINSAAQMSPNINFVIFPAV